MPHTTRKRPGRPPTVKKTPTTKRQIPLSMLHRDVRMLDRAARRAGLSRAEWCRQVLTVEALRQLDAARA